MFVLIYSNHNNNSKRFKFRGYHLAKGIIKNYNAIINGKNYHDGTTDSDIKYKEIRKLTTGQGENYTTWHLLDYENIKNHYRVKTVDLSREKELDPDPKAIQFSKQNLLGNWKMEPIQLLLVNQFALTNLKKNQRNKIKIFPRKFNSLIKDGKLWRSKSYTNTNTPLNKLKSTAKNKHVTYIVYCKYIRNILICIFLFYFSWPFPKKA